ncbi:MAG: hypothetical protein AAF993_06325 [Pseudomonadota bacterium]
MRIGFLHTADVHQITFDKLLNAYPEARAEHRIHPEWLSRAQQEGLTTDLQQLVTQALTELAATNDAVVCTCSTLGPIVDLLQQTKILRVDQPMMARAVRHSPVLLVMCVASTVPVSTALLQAEFSRQQQPEAMQTLLCESAWAFFEQGDLTAYGRAIADAVCDAVGANPELKCIVLAQASMRAAEPYLEHLDIPVLSSPELAVERAVALAAQQAQT